MVERFKFLFADDRGIYGIKDTGQLLWWPISAADAGTLVLSAGTEVGTGWDVFSHVFAGGFDGTGCIVYALKPSGELLWYRDTGPCAGNPTKSWSSGSGTVVADGWTNKLHVFSDLTGIIYATLPDGTLQYYKHTSRGPTRDWDNNGTPASIGTGWSSFTSLVSGGAIGDTRIFYARGQDGNLLCYRKATSSSTGDMAGLGSTSVVLPALPSAINNGMPVFRSPTGEWGQFTHLFAGRAGEIYAIRNEEFGGRIYKFKTLSSGLLEDYTPRSLFGMPVSDCGWQIIPIEGYAWPLSAAPTGTVKFCASALLPADCAVSFAKLGGLPLRPRTVERGYHANPVTSPLSAATASVPFQATTATSWSAGCGWSSSFQITVPADWSSGFYLARCTAKTGYVYDIPFIVKPAAAQVSSALHSNDIAVISNVTTWNAYNVWGGKSNYNNSDTTARAFSYLRPNHHLLTAFEDHGWGTHLLRGEIWIFEWLQNTYGSARVHLYTDLDLHNGSFLDSYKCVVISTHPEYWSNTMITKLNTYLQNGGKILYLGGNSLYRLTEISGTFTGETTDTAAMSTSQTGDNAGVDNRSMLGISVGTLSMVGATLACYPFGLVVPTHEFFNWPNRVTGAAFADSGWNNVFDQQGGAGIETEWVTGAPAHVQVLARANVPGYGADMAIYNYPQSVAGGWTVGIGSVVIGGALRSDANTQAIVKNVLHFAGVDPT